MSFAVQAVQSAGSCVVVQPDATSRPARCSPLLLVLDQNSEQTHTHLFMSFGSVFVGTFYASFCDLLDFWRRYQIIMIARRFVFVFLVTSSLHVSFRDLFLTFCRLSGGTVGAFFYLFLTFSTFDGGVAGSFLVLHLRWQAMLIACRFFVWCFDPAKSFRH